MPFPFLCHISLKCAYVLLSSPMICEKKKIDVNKMVNFVLNFFFSLGIVVVCCCGRRKTSGTFYKIGCIYILFFFLHHVTFNYAWNSHQIISLIYVTFSHFSWISLLSSLIYSIWIWCQCERLNDKYTYIYSHYIDREKHETV